MTTILYHDNHVYADSLIVKGLERFQSLTKIKKLAEPLVLSSEAKEEYNDTIYGWAASGAEETFEAVVSYLLHKKSLTSLETLLKILAKCKVINELNTFSVMLFGKKRHYTFSLNVDGWNLDVEPEDGTTVIGFGAEHVMDMLREGASPVKAFFHAFYISPKYTGGMIDVWKIDREKDTFKRLGIISERTRSELVAELLDMKDGSTYDLCTHDGWLKSLIEQVKNKEKQQNSKTKTTTARQRVLAVKDKHKATAPTKRTPVKKGRKS